MTKYSLFYQKPYCCAIACLQMILFRHTEKVFAQEEMAWFFDVKVASKMANIYAYPFRHLTNHGNDEGVSTMDLTKPLERFFSLHNVPLRTTAHIGTVEFLSGLDKWISFHMDSQADLWVEYSNGDKENPKDLHIHDSLIERYDPETRIVTLLDPNPNARNYREMHLEELKDRLSGTFWKRTWIMLVEAD